MRRYWRIIALGAGAYLLILLFSWPAERAAGYLEQQFTGLSLQAVSGSVYSGRAGSLTIQDLQAGAVNWIMRPAALLLGRLEYHITLDGGSLQGRGDIGSGLFGGLVAHDVSAHLAPDFLLERFSTLSIKATGRITLAIEKLRIRDGFPDELYGRMSWKNAALQEPVALSLGQVDVELGSTGDRVTGNISNSSGDVTVAGDISIASTGQYDLLLQLTPAATAPSELVQMLDAYGQRQPGGSYLLKESGRW